VCSSGIGWHCFFFFNCSEQQFLCQQFYPREKYAPQILFCDSRQQKIVFILELKEKGLS